MNIDTDLLQELSDEFSDFTEMRHQTGASEYGATTFLDVDTINMAAEELADLANYARYLYIKLRLIQEGLNERGIDLSAGLTKEAGRENSVSFGPTAFVPSSEVQRFLPVEE